MLLVAALCFGHWRASLLHAHVWESSHPGQPIPFRLFAAAVGWQDPIFSKGRASVYLVVPAIFVTAYGARRIRDVLSLITPSPPATPSSRAKYF